MFEFGAKDQLLDAQSNSMNDNTGLLDAVKGVVESRVEAENQSLTEYWKAQDSNANRLSQRKIQSKKILVVSDLMQVLESKKISNDWIV